LFAPVRRICRDTVTAVTDSAHKRLGIASV